MRKMIDLEDPVSDSNGVAEDYFMEPLEKIGP